MTISGSGLISGLDTKAMIQQLVQLERQPILRIQQRKSAVTTEISSLGNLSSKMSELGTLMGKMKDLSEALAAKTSTTDENVVTATATSDAVMTDYDIIVNQLAEAARDRSAIMTNGGATEIKEGTIEITVGDNDPVEITVDAGMTLNEVRDAINAADANVAATVMNRSDGLAFLHITSNETGYDPVAGEATALVINESYTGGTGAELNMARVRNAENALVVVDGMPATPRRSNQIDDIIDGVTFNLHSVSPFEDGETFPRVTNTISVEPDQEKMVEQVEDFVKQYNAIMTDLGKELEKGGSIKRNARQDMQALISSQLGTDELYNSLSSIGITTNHNNGQLVLDNSKLEQAINDDAVGVANVFAAETTGLAVQMDDLLNTYTDRYDGRIKLSQDSLESMVKSLDTQIDRQNTRLIRYEESLKRRFANLEVMLSDLQDVGSRFGAMMPY